MNTAKTNKFKITGILLALVILVSFALSSNLNFTSHAATLPFEIGKEAVDQDLPHADSESGNYRQNFADLVGSLLSIVIPVSALILLLYLIWGAIEWLASGGDKGKLEKARGRITTGVIGIIVVSATISLFMLMQQILNVCVLDFWGTDCKGPNATATKESTDPSYANTSCGPLGAIRCNNRDVWVCESETGKWDYWYTCSYGTSCNQLDPNNPCQ